LKTTNASRIISVFRQARAVPEEKEVFLVFDGDKLQPDNLISDTEIGDMDNIDVHVK
jgi:hypothetical protein